MQQKLKLFKELFADYTSKYLDLKDKLGSDPSPEKTSILNDIDFELELIRRDTINVTYILQLLIKFKSKYSTKDKDSIQKDIFNLLNNLMN